MEPLEDRTLLSSIKAVHSVAPRGYSKIVWHNKAAYTRTNQWILTVNKLNGSTAQRAASMAKMLRRVTTAVSVTQCLGTTGSFLVKTRKPMAYKAIFSACRRIAGFSSVEPDLLLNVSATTPNDPGYQYQYGLNNAEQVGADIHASDAWDISQGSSDVIIAVIDTGVQLDHPDLAANIWTNPGEIPGDGIDNDGNGYVDDVNGWNFAGNTNNPSDDFGHGTAVAGIISAVGNNGVGVAGVSWHTKILPLKFLDSTGHGDAAEAIAALNYCIDLKRRGINIVASNNSWGGDENSTPLLRAINDFGNAGMIFVAAAGNDGANTDTSPSYPAAYNSPNIISVAATTSTDALAGFSNRGATSVDLGAPGDNIYSTNRFSAYGAGSGTSFAAPFVSGVVALAYAISPRNVSYQTIRDAVLDGGDSIPALAGVTVTGKRLNAYGTLMQLPMLVLSATPGSGQIVTSLPTKFTLTFSHPVDSASLDPADLTVNGTPADSVSTTTDPHTVVFHFGTSPVVDQGVQTITMASGAVQRQGDARGVEAASMTFRYDALVLRVATSTPADGATVAPPLTEIDLNMNEAVAVASLQVSDLRLSRGTVVGASLLDPQTVRFLVSGLTEANLTLSMAAGALTDIYGNPSGSWTGSIVLDVGTAGFPVPLPALPPLGSRVHAGTWAGMVNAPGDVDVFTIDLAPGQNASVKVTASGGLMPVLEVRDASGTLVVSASAGANGIALGSLIPVGAVGGTYSITVSGASSPWGSYALAVTVNSDIEAELAGGSTNDTPASAQSLDNVFQSLSLGGQAAAVSGRTDLPSGILPGEIEPNDSIGQANEARYNFVSATAGVYQIGIKASSDNTTDSDYYNLGPLSAGELLTLAMSGHSSARGTLGDPYIELYRWNGGSPLLVAASDDDGPAAGSKTGRDSFIYHRPITTSDVYYVLAKCFYPPGGTGTYDLAAYLENVATPPGMSNPTTAEVEPNDSFDTATDVSQAWRALDYASSTSGEISATSDHDVYSYTLHAGELLSVYVRATSGSLVNSAISIMDASGTVVALDDGFTNYLNADSGIWSYIVPADGVYYVDVHAPTGTGSYTLGVALSSATLPPQPSPVPDFYSASLHAGEHVSVALSVLDPGAITLELQDAMGVAMADGVTTANASCLVSDFVVPATGTYYLRVQGDRNLDYVLWMGRGSGFGVKPNNTPAQAMPLGATGATSAYLIAGDEDWYSFTAFAGDLVQVQTATPGGTTGAYVNLLDPAIELYDPTGALIGSDSSGAGDGRNALLNFTAGANGTYRVRLIPQAGAGEYQLAVADFNAGLPGAFGNDVYKVQLAGDGVTLNILTNGVVTWSAPAAMFTGLTINDPAGNDTLSIETPLAFVPRLLGSGADTMAFLAGSYVLSQDLGVGGRDIGLSVFGATCDSPASQRLRFVTIGDAGTLRMTAGAPAVLRTGSLYISGNGLLDMGNHDLILDYAGPSPIDRLRQYLSNGIAGSGASIITTAVTPDGHPAALGPVDNQQIQQLAWNGEALSTGSIFSQVIIKFTYLGDVNLDGRVDASDYYSVFGNMSAAAGWFQGDVDYDGTVTPTDAAIVENNFGAGTEPGMAL